MSGPHPPGSPSLPVLLGLLALEAAVWLVMAIDFRRQQGRDR